MKWFIVIVLIADGGNPKFMATSMPSFDVCQQAVSAARVDVAPQGEHGNAIAAYCATGTPTISAWNYNGKLWYATPTEAQ